MSSNWIEHLYSRGWFVLPRNFIAMYGKKLSSFGIPLYAFMAATADIDLTVQLTDDVMQKAHELIGKKMDATLAILEQVKLIKCIEPGKNPIYQLLWIPWGLDDNPNPCNDDNQPRLSNKRIVISFKSNDRRKFKNSLRSPYHMNHSKAELAQEIADTLNDLEALPLYESFTRRYSEKYLRAQLAKAMAIPSHKIKRTRGALFTFLVQKGHDK
jgi:hypothetical protein